MTTVTTCFPVGELARQLGGELRGQPDVQITGVNSLEEARNGEMTFITKSAYLLKWPQSKAAAALVNNNLQPPVNDTRPLIFVVSAEHAMIRLLELFAVPETAPELGVHSSAVIHPTAALGKDVRIGPHVSVDSDCVIGDGVTLHAGVRLGANVQVGMRSVLHANTVIRQGCVIGRGVILHQNVSIGADGFGYRPAPNNAGLIKIPHIGNVIIEDAVEIGANTCVDRGKFGSTIIGAGTKIDNLCQIAHNCRIGRACVIAGQTGIAGSVIVGDGVQMGGRAGVSDHITIGHGAKIGATALVTRDMPAGETWLGNPADQAQQVLRQWACIRKLPVLLRRMSRLDSTEG